jgi:hypothetical protein
MTESEHKWIETNKDACAVLRQLHDMLALSSLPPRRTWVDLTKEECFELCVKHKDNSFSLLVAVQEKLMEKNT